MKLLLEFISTVTLIETEELVTVTVAPEQYDGRQSHNTLLIRRENNVLF